MAAEDIEPLLATVAYLKPLTNRIIIVGPVPRYDQPLPSILARGMIAGDLSMVASHCIGGISALDKAMRLAIDGKADYISMMDALCPADNCRLFAAPNAPMQFDYHHFTDEGARITMQTLRDRQGVRF